MKQTRAATTATRMSTTPSPRKPAHCPAPRPPRPGTWVFAYNADYGRQEPYRVDIIRGEDGSMALNLKKYGRIIFVHDKRCRAITGYGTIGKQSMWRSFVDHVKIQMKGIGRIFHKTDHYDDAPDNLVRT